ncbi:TPA: hypothetical protein DIV55_06410 [Patescibacteria group bacterium]|uniref:Polynucleotide adenylyltransferase/metal dependent phosphohydrolase n=1 Tax=Candidatus Gottesmanbacteria bacterium GW2011_GWA1_43_11 TaxID=1618436 RepID=A0A0G1CDE3_9BACT|nr:MAG: Polynucleotide adenylyltransferase/metal dependent phosphohydrolase [Candidatus Gottesmanbacteria bacterium GW2011_GWA1_43_11]HCS79339.1 hypothetical protein [Patescibacteria group bacterium]
MILGLIYSFRPMWFELSTVTSSHPSPRLRNGKANSDRSNQNVSKKLPKLTNMHFEKINISTVTSQSLKGRKYLDSFPEYYELATVIENNLWHNNQNVLDHVIGVFAGLEVVLKFTDLKATQKILLEKYLSVVIGHRTKKEALIVATLLHDIAKTDTLVKHPDGTASCPGHELIAAGRVKRFSNRFDLSKNDEAYVERIVRYHGFISEILNLIIDNSNKEKYLEIFQDTVGDIAIELVLLMHADMLGSDLEASDKKAYTDRINTLSWILDQLMEKYE